MPLTWKRNGPVLLPALIAGLWTALTGALAFRLVRPAAPQAGSSAVIGRVVLASGDVKVRPGASLIWAPAAAGSQLHEGDMIATGDSSGAALLLTDKQQVDVGANSIVELASATADSGAHGAGLELQLLKGRLAAAAGGGSPSALRAALSRLGFGSASGRGRVAIHTGSTVFDLPAGQAARLALSRPNADAAATVTAVTGGVTATTPSGTTALAAAEIVPQPGVPNSLPLTVAAAGEGGTAAGGAPVGLADAGGAPQGPGVAAAGDATQAAVPVAAFSLGRLSPLDFSVPEDNLPAPAVARAAPVLPAALHVPMNRKLGPLAVKRLEPPPPLAPVPPQVDWSPQLADDQPRVLFTAAQLKVGCTAPGLPVMVTPPRVAGTPPAAWTPFLDVALPGGTDRFLRVRGRPGFVRQTLVLPMQDICAWLSPAARLDVALQLRPGATYGGTEVSAPAAVRLVAASLTGLPEQPVTVHFIRFAASGQAATGWLPAATLRTGMALRISGRSLPKLLPLLAANGYVSLSDAPINAAYPARAQFIAFGRLIATLGLPGVDRQVIARLAVQLGADVAFMGDPTAFVQLPRGRINRLNVLEGLLGANGRLRLVSHDRIVTIEESDLDSGAESLQALTFTADLAFTKDVDIVVPRQATAH